MPYTSAGISMHASSSECESCALETIAVSLKRTELSDVRKLAIGCSFMKDLISSTLRVTTFDNKFLVKEDPIQVLINFPRQPALQVHISLSWARTTVDDASKQLRQRFL